MRRLCLAVWLFQLVTLTVSAQSLEWMRQLGTDDEDVSRGLAIDALGNVYLVGDTGGSLGGTLAGDYDAFVSKYDDAGALQWSRQLGTSGRDLGFGVSTDGLQNVYVTGCTNGVLGAASDGEYDGFLSKFDAAGGLQWTRQFGTNLWDLPRSLAVDTNGDAYIAGTTQGSLGGANAGSSDVFVAKYDAAGSLQWTRQLGSGAFEEAHGISLDGAGNLYVTGYTEGSLGGPNAGSFDAHVSKFTVAGELLWTRQFGTVENDRALGISADQLGNIFVAGHTHGSLSGVNAGERDLFVTKLDSAGNLNWTRQLGTATDDTSEWSVSVDGLGGAYFAGYTRGDLAGANLGGTDVVFGRFDIAGNLQSIEQFGTSAADWPSGIRADNAGNFHLSGSTFGSLAGDNSGRGDVFLAKFRVVVPEPNSLFLAAFSVAACGLRRRHNKNNP